MKEKKPIVKIISLLKKQYPKKFNGSIISRDPFKVLIGTILSHQTRDERTISASRKLFKKFDTPSKLAKAELNEIRDLIKEVGIYNIKAKRIKELSNILLQNYGGKVPEDYNTLLSLPGVGRKTANIVFTHAFGKEDYIAVDTHVHKISNRLGIVNTKTSDQTEQILYKVIPRKEWKFINELFVQHGQNICKSKPICEKCVISNYCDYYIFKRKGRLNKRERKIQHSS